jgi:hypothetical protein
METLDEKAEAIRADLRRAIESSPETKAVPRKAKLIEAARAEIAQLRTKGWNWKEISEATKGSLDASPELIRQVINRTLPPPKPRKVGPRTRKPSKQAKAPASTKPAVTAEKPLPGQAQTVPQVQPVRNVSKPQASEPEERDISQV